VSLEIITAGAHEVGCHDEEKGERTFPDRNGVSGKEHRPVYAGVFCPFLKIGLVKIEKIKNVFLNWPIASNCEIIYFGLVTFKETPIKD